MDDGRINYEGSTGETLSWETKGDQEKCEDGVEAEKQYRIVIYSVLVKHLFQT